MPVVNTACTRCGRALQFTGRLPGPDARLVRRSKVPEGHCAACAVSNWLQHTEPLRTVLATKGPEILLDRHTVDQMSAVLAAGCADAKPQEIDWVSVVIHWDLPFAERWRVMRPDAPSEDYRTRPAAEKAARGLTRLGRSATVHHWEDGRWVAHEQTEIF